MTVYHNGKFPRSKKTVGFEFGLLSAAFPHVCEGITADNLSDRQRIHNKQAGLIGALGTFYIVYCLFVMAIMETLVVGCSGLRLLQTEPPAMHKLILYLSEEVVLLLLEAHLI